MQVVEMNSWMITYSGRLRDRVDSASFFEDSERLYAETTSFWNRGQLTTLQVVIDLRDRQLTERLRLEHPDVGSTFYTALGDGFLLAEELAAKPRIHTALTRVRLPEYTEIVRVPFATRDREQVSRETDVFISADRGTIAYAFDHTIVCRRSADLRIIWSQDIDQDLYGVSRLAVSADGGRVAAAVLDRGTRGKERRDYVGVYDGAGTLLARLPMRSESALGISPAGELLAVGRQTLDSKTGDLHLGIDIYEIKTNRQVAALSRDRVPPGRLQLLNGGFESDGIQFTSDGKYLITSGNNNVKVWELA
jgi:hypothetical protein